MIILIMVIIGMYVYGQYSNSKDMKDSFEYNSKRTYTKYGNLTLTRRPTEMIEILIDGYLFVKIDPAGIKNKGINIVEVYNVPVGSELTYIVVPLIGQKKVIQKYTVTEEMLFHVSNTKQEVPKYYMGSDMSI